MAANDPGSNYTIADVLDAKSRVADTYYTTAVTHATAGFATTFLLSCGTYASGITATVQYSDDNSSWTDQTDDGSGNEVSDTLAATGSIQLDVPNPRGKYSRVKVVLAGTCVVSVTAISGPKLLNAPSSTSYVS